MSQALADHLFEAHRALLAALDAALDAPGGFDRPAYDAFRAEWLRHMAVEERLVVQPLKAKGVTVEGSYEVRVEHAAFASLLAAAPDASLARELRALMVAHLAREEAPGGLFDALAKNPYGPADLVESAKQFPKVKTAQYSTAPWLPRTAEKALTLARGLLPPPHPHE